MCLIQTPDVPTPTAPKETAAMRAPDGAVVRSNASRRTEDRIRAGADTVLTSGSGVTDFAQTQKKTLLGQ